MNHVPQDDFNKKLIAWIALGITVIGCLIALMMWGIPTYNVWQKGLEGKAVLAKAEFSRQARVMSAQAEKDAADLTAASIKIVGEAAQKYPEYRQQEFILAFGEALREGSINQIIYVPTEAMIPITEAGKLVK